MRKLKSYRLLSLLLPLIGFLVVAEISDSTMLAIDSFPVQEEKAVWERYTAQGEEFSVMMPELPGVIASSKCLDFNCQTDRLETTYAAYSDGVVYLVTSYENPHRRQSLEEIIAEKIGADEMNSKDTVKSDLKLNKFKGKKFITMSKTYGYDMLSVFYLTEAHVYEVAAVGGSRKDAAIQKFFKSFTLGSTRGKEIGAGARTGADSPPAKDVPTSKDVQAPAVFKPADVMRKAIIIVKPAPEYTEEARRNQVTGTVTLQMVFAASGRVTNIHALTSLPYGLTEKAINAARKIYFLPAMKDGKRVGQYIRVEYNFNIY